MAAHLEGVPLPLPLLEAAELGLALGEGVDLLLGEAAAVSCNTKQPSMGNVVLHSRQLLT
jgi:hypothetical protein